MNIEREIYNVLEEKGCFNLKRDSKLILKSVLKIIKDRYKSESPLNLINEVYLSDEFHDEQDGHYDKNDIPKLPIIITNYSIDGFKSIIFYNWLLIDSLNREYNMFFIFNKNGYTEYSIQICYPY